MPLAEPFSRKRANMETISVKGIPGEISLLRSSRKSVTVTVDTEGRITVRAPLRLPLRDITAFLERKAARICGMLERQNGMREQVKALPPLDAAELERLADQAVQVIPPKVRHFAELLGVTYGRITIRNQKTRWGSCTAEGNLNFNCLLMLAPEDVLDSVIVHELCHRLEMNHSARFYEAVYRVFPDYDRCQKWLKENGTLLLRRMTGR